MARLDRSGEFRTAFEKNRKIILATQDVCGICGNPIDKSIKYPHPMSATVDHIIPLAKGGHPSDLANLQIAHRWCNRQKSDKLIDRKSMFASLEAVNNDDLPQHYDWQHYTAITI